MKRLTVLVAAPLLVICLVLSGCVVLESSAISERSGGGRSVSTSASDYGILALTTPYGLTGTANSQLMAQCQSGKVSNVQTELSMRNFILVQLYSISATGVCQ